MIRETVLVTMVAECDVGLCDTGSGSICHEVKGENSARLIEELKEAGWVFVEAVKLDVCPRCVRAILERRKASKEKTNGA